MATRRATPNGGAAASPSTSRSSSIKIGAKETPTATSYLLPTSLEALLLIIYPATLVLGALYSTLHPDIRKAEYSVITQSYPADQAPSYFARKDNILNVLFVKIGWIWFTLSFLAFTFSHPFLGAPFQPLLTTRRTKALARFASITTVWIFVTQWFFGPPVIDRSFRWTGGKCAVALRDSEASWTEHDQIKAGEAFTHVACKAIGGQWKGGHDISGHVFMLILGSAMLWLEFLPVVLRSRGGRETRNILTAEGSARNEARGRDNAATSESGELGLGIVAALAVIALSWWMLLMTGAYFHTWFEKLTGLTVAFAAIYTVYFLPRSMPSLQKLLGLPGL